MTTDQNGNRKPIPCEKEAIGVTLLEMLRKRRQYHLGFDQRDLYRWFTALQSSFMRGLPQRLTLKLPETVQEFCAEYFFCTPADAERDSSGATPLMFAALSGNLAVTAVLLTREGVDVNAQIRAAVPLFGAPKGSSALHKVMAYGADNVHEMIALLLNHGADPNLEAEGGTTPLMAGVQFQNASATERLIRCAGERLEIEKGMDLNNNTALGLACYLGTTEIITILAEAGADFTHVTAFGSDKLDDAGVFATPGVAAKARSRLRAFSGMNLSFLPYASLFQSRMRM